MRHGMLRSRNPLGQLAFALSTSTVPHLMRERQLELGYALPKVPSTSSTYASRKPWMTLSDMVPTFQRLTSGKIS